MGVEQVLNWSITYGLGIVLSVLIAFGAWKVLIYVLKENTKREDRLAGIIENHLGKLDSSMSMLADALKQREGHLEDLKEANRQQRHEHKEIVFSQVEISKILQSILNRLEILSEKK
jgi:hypothetical protein